MYFTFDPQVQVNRVSGEQLAVGVHRHGTQFDLVPDPDEFVEAGDPHVVIGAVDGGSSLGGQGLVSLVADFTCYIHRAGGGKIYFLEVEGDVCVAILIKG